jgi:hypothetical protein
MGRGTELALTPLIFVGLGWLIDRAAGTSPGFTIAVGALGITGTFVKAWLGYDQDMRRVEAGKPWAPRTAAEGPAASPDQGEAT